MSRDRGWLRDVADDRDVAAAGGAGARGPGAELVRAVAAFVQLAAVVQDLGDVRSDAGDPVGAGRQLDGEAAGPADRAADCRMAGPHEARPAGQRDGLGLLAAGAQRAADPVE